MLINRLVELGYLRALPQERRFVPTLRIALMGSNYLAQGQHLKGLLSCFEELCETAGNLCFMAQRNGPSLQYIAFRQLDAGEEPAPRVGLTRPLTLAASGKVLLSFMPETEVLGILHRNNAEAPSKQCLIAPGALMSDLELIRSQGIAESDPQFTPGLIGFATWLTDKDTQIAYAIGVAIPTRSRKRNRDRAVHALYKINQDSALLADSARNPIGL
jgi:DNA-binding IclR family transcriptional regulator